MLDELKGCDCQKKRSFVRQIIKVSKKHEFTIYQGVEDEYFRILEINGEEDNYADYYKNLSLLYELLGKIECNKCLV